MTDQEKKINDIAEDDFYEDYSENEPNESCEKCSRYYNHIDYDYQCCSKCGWDAEQKKYGKKSEPTEDDYLSGDADILTGCWY